MAKDSVYQTARREMGLSPFSFTCVQDNNTDPRKSR